jgi:radical SAM superfamily enzyme YgiQ (UPF0313 family)
MLRGMSLIVLATLNARYIHSAFGLRYLKANLGELESDCEIQEFDIGQRPIDICEKILDRSPKLVGFGVYIWNAVQTLQVVKLMRKIAPQVLIVLGGPEVSYETDEQEICRLADYVICFEGEQVFRTLATQLLGGERPEQRVLRAATPDVTALSFPYRLYNEKDIESRLIYVEASRGCPFTCEFCLSSLDIPVRQFDVEAFLIEMRLLFERGVRHFKFVDRTFNLNLRVSSRILEFFLELYQPGLFVHFEMVPDRLPQQLRNLIMRFPKGALQFEVGIQSFNPEVGVNISRRQDFAKLAENLTFLREQAAVHVHADLIVGLPGEKIESFAAGFNRLFALKPQEIQVGILKRLRGTPIVRHVEKFNLVFNPDPPYELLSNCDLDFATMQKLSRFSRYWDLISNSGNFIEVSGHLLAQGEGAFEAFYAFSNWLFSRTGARHAFALKALAELLYEYLTEICLLDKEIVAAALRADYLRLGRSDLPACLDIGRHGAHEKVSAQGRQHARRQQRHDANS